MRKKHFYAKEFVARTVTPSHRKHRSTPDVILAAFGTATTAPLLQVAKVLKGVKHGSFRCIRFGLVLLEVSGLPPGGAGSRMTVG